MIVIHEKLLQLCTQLKLLQNESLTGAVFYQLSYEGNGTWSLCIVHNNYSQKNMKILKLYDVVGHWLDSVEG